MATQEERTEASRRAIVQAARRLFTDRRTIDIGLGEIAREAGVSRANIHYQFGSRLDLLAAVVDEISSDLDVAAHGPDDVDPASYIRGVLLAQQEPAAIIHHYLGDALTMAGHGSVDVRLHQFAERLAALGCSGDTLIIAAATTLFARQVAFGYFDKADIDRFVDGLQAGVKIPEAKP